MVREQETERKREGHARSGGFFSGTKHEVGSGSDDWATAEHILAERGSTVECTSMAPTRFDSSTLKMWIDSNTGSQSAKDGVWRMKTFSVLP